MLIIATDIINLIFKLLSVLTKKQINKSYVFLKHFNRRYNKIYISQKHFNKHKFLFQSSFANC